MKSATSFLKVFYTFFALFGLVFLGVGVGITLDMHGGLVFLLAFGLTGLVFFLIGAIGLVVLARKARLRRWLLENGRVLNAEVDGVSQNYAISMNGRRPYVLECHYTDAATRTLYQFRSEPVFFNPEATAGQLRSVRVYVHPDDYRKYLVDPQALTGGYNVIG